MSAYLGSTPVSIKEAFYRNHSTVDLLAKGTSVLKSVFDPLTLFKDGKQGVWYDPSDKSTLFQDAYGRIPVAKDGDPVGLMLDKSQGLPVVDAVSLNATTGSASEWIVNGDGTYTSNGAKDAAGWLDVEVGSIETAYYEVEFTILEYTSGYIRFQSPEATPYGDMKSGAVSRHVIRIQSGYMLGILSVRFFGTIHNIKIRKIAGNHARQTVSSARPVYKTDGVLSWLEFDGADDFLSTPFNGILAQNTFINIGYKYDTIKSAQTLVSSGISGATDVVIGTINDTQMAVYGSGVSLSVGESTSLNSAVSVAWGDNGARSIRRNSDGYISSTPTQSNFTTKYPINLGAAYSGTRPMKGRIYGVLIVELTDALLRDRLNNFTMAKSGVPL